MKSNFVGGQFLKVWSSIGLPRGMWGPTKTLCPIGSAVLAFIGYKQTNKHPDKQSMHIDEKKMCQGLIFSYRA